mgnify:CR=1 FL=1
MSADVTRIEFADVDEMAFLYQDRISVWLGTLNELEYKLKLAKHVLLNEDGKGCAATDTGKLDFTHISMSSTRKFTFAQGEPELPSGYIVPEPVEETPAEEGVTGETAESTATDGTARQRRCRRRCCCRNTNGCRRSPGRTRSRTDCTADPAEGTTPAAGDADPTQTTQ